MPPGRPLLADRADDGIGDLADHIERDVVGAQERRRQGTGAPLASDLTRPLGGARPKDLPRPSSPLLGEVRQRADGLLGPGRQRRHGPESDDRRGGRALAVVTDVRLDQAVLLDARCRVIGRRTRGSGPPATGASSQAEVPVRAAVPLLPLDPEQSREAVGQHRVVVLRQRDDRRVKAGARPGCATARPRSSGPCWR